MVARDRLVQAPPDALDGVALRRVHGQVVQHDPPAPPRQVLLDHLGLLRLVAGGVVADDVDDPVVPQGTPQVVQVPAEQRRPTPLLGQPPGQEDPARPPVDAAGQVALLVGGLNNSHQMK